MTSTPGLAYPALQPYLEMLRPAMACAGERRVAQLNERAASQKLCNGFGRRLRFVPAAGPLHAVDYEWQIGGDSHALEGLVDTRTEGDGGEHDVLNAMAWLHFPHTKACLNVRHVEEIRLLAEQDRRRVRSPARDRLTLFDENGAVLLTEDARVVESLVTRQWTRLFFEERERLLAHSQLLIFGHGLLQKCLRPFASMTARVMVLNMPASSALAEVDVALADSLNEHWPALPTRVMPICGWPGWDAGGAGVLAQDEAFYANRAVFRV